MCPGNSVKEHYLEVQINNCLERLTELKSLTGLLSAGCIQLGFLFVSFGSTSCLFVSCCITFVQQSFRLAKALQCPQEGERAMYCDVWAMLEVLYRTVFLLADPCRLGANVYGLSCS